MALNKKWAEERRAEISLRILAFRIMRHHKDTQIKNFKGIISLKCEQNSRCSRSHDLKC